MDDLNDLFPQESLRRITRRYGVSFALGILSITFLGISLGGIYMLRHGGDPMDAMTVPGLPCFIFGYILMFMQRLILWKRVPPRLRNIVRNSLKSLFALLLLVTVCTIAIAVFQPVVPGTVVYFTVAASLCQIGTALWLFRYADDV